MATSGSDEPFVIRDDADGITTLTMNRPDDRNPLSVGMLDELDRHLIELGTNPDVRVVVLAGNGPAFSAGHDLRELHPRDDPAFHEEVFTNCSTVMQRVAALPHPVIAKVGGVATAAGCQLVATCDLAVASRSSRFSTPGVNIGLFCSTPAVALSRVLLPKHAMKMLLTGQMIDAAEAYRIGLVNDVVDDEDLDTAVAELASVIASKPPAVIAAGKATYHAQVNRPLAEAYRLATTAMVDGMSNPNATEGIGAFLEKRQPRWISTP